MDPQKELDYIWEKCKEGDILTVQNWLQRNPDKIDTKNPLWKSSTLLYTAARNGRTKLVYILLNRGADPNITQENCSTPLHGAVFSNFYDCVVALLQDIRTQIDILNK